MTLAPNDPRHGTDNGYGNLRCRCDECASAWAEKHLAYMRSHPEQYIKHRVREYLRRHRSDLTVEQRRMLVDEMLAAGLKTANEFALYLSLIKEP